ncbi:MAG: hypothetical protein IKR69_03695 [Bacteroidales bacterium]|nr:hypothetical protein [Bacteroidales bacterium]
MTKYSFILLSSGKEEFLEKLQEIGLVDITRSSKAIDDKSAADFESISSRLRTVTRLKSVPFTAEGPLPAVSDPVAEGNAALSRLDEIAAEKAALRRELESVSAWGEFDRKKIEAIRNCGLDFHFYRVPEKKFDPSWKEEYPIQIVSEGKSVFFVAVLPSGSEPVLPSFEIKAPSRSAAEVRSAIEAAEALEKEQQAIVISCRGRIPEIEREIAREESSLDLYLASAATGSAAEEHLTVVTGFAPTENESSLDAAFNSMDVLWIKAAASVQDNPPIKLRNSRFVKMFETLTDMYGRPAYDGFDPTVFISIFFLLFFAFCMGDMGYGLILIAAGLALMKVPSFKDMAPLVVTLGIGTTVIGFFFHTFFSLDIATWEVFAPIKGIFLPSEIAGYDGTMVAAIVVGIIHLSLALIVKAVHASKVNGFWKSLGAWGWALLIVGGVIIAALAFAGFLSSDSPGAPMVSRTAKIVIIVLGVLAFIGIFPLNGKGKNPLVNTALGLWDTYGMVTGMLGDVLSYLRLYALGLAGAMLGKAFNEIALMVLGDGSVRAFWIFFILIVVVGHTLNFAMAALGAFVHPLRLNFLEFFKNSGYEADGREYKPLKINKS